MPIYTYQCQDCERIQDAHRSIAKRNDSPVCPCGGDTAKKIVPAMVAPVMGGGSFPGYQCPVSNEFVTSRKQRREIMKRHDLVEKG